MAGAKKGSQKWLQRAVAEGWLDHCLLDELEGATTIVWLSPLADNDYAEYRDREFLKQLGLGHLASALTEFWPMGGPRWDGLAKSDAGHVLLIEAKAHVSEFCTTPCQAKSKDSKALISAAIKRTAKSLRVPQAHLSDWTTHFYQYANRLCHLQWMREHEVNAKLVFVDFVHDDEMPGRTTVEAWKAAHRLADYVLGLPPQHALKRHIIHLYPDTADR